MNLKLIGLAILCASLCGCVSGKQASDLAAADAGRASVKPQDEVPVECKQDTKKRPRLANRDYDGAASARAYKTLSNQYDSEGNRADRCRMWARGQR